MLKSFEINDEVTSRPQLVNRNKDLLIEIQKKINQKKIHFLNTALLILNDRKPLPNFDAVVHRILDGKLFEKVLVTGFKFDSLYGQNMDMLVYSATSELPNKNSNTEILLPEFCDLIKIPKPRTYDLLILNDFPNPRNLLLFSLKEKGNLLFVVKQLSQPITINRLWYLSKSFQKVTVFTRKTPLVTNRQKDYDKFIYAENYTKKKSSENSTGEDYDVYEEMGDIEMYPLHFAYGVIDITNTIQKLHDEFTEKCLYLAELLEFSEDFKKNI